MNKLGTVLLFVAGLLLAFYLGFKIGLHTEYEAAADSVVETTPAEESVKSVCHWTLDDLQQHAAKWKTEIEIEQSNDQYKVTLDAITFEYFDTTQSCWEYTAHFKGYQKYFTLTSLSRKLDFRIIMKENEEGGVTWSNYDIKRNI